MRRHFYTQIPLVIYYLFFVFVQEGMAQNVGVNTDGTTPTELLHVKSTAAAQNHVLIQHTLGAQQLALRLYNSATASADWKLYVPASSSNLRLYNSSDRVIFLSTGQVGINMTPATNFMLDVTSTSTTTGDAAIRGQANSAAQVYGILGATSSITNNATGVRGYASGASGLTNGVWGEAASSAGAGIYGLATSVSGNGVYGYNSAANASSGGTGVYGTSNQSLGAGVWGEGNSTTAGVYGSSSSKDAYNAGVFGENTNNTGGTSWLPAQITAGVGGRIFGTAAYSAGVYGYNNNSTVNNNAAMFAQDGQGYKAGLVFTYTPSAIQRTLPVYGEGLGLSSDDRAVQGLWNVNDANAPWGFIGDNATGLYASCGTAASGKGVWGNASVGTGYGGYFNNSGTGLYATTSTPASYWGIYCAAGGGLANGNSWVNSDRRFKKNISQLPDGILNKIMKLNPCQYSFDADKFPIFRGNEENQIGLIAQELEQVFPELVNNKKYIPDPAVDPYGEKTPAMVKGYYAVDYVSLTPILIKGMQEQQQLIAKMQSQIDNKIYNEGTSELINGKMRVNFDASFIELIGSNKPVVSVTPMGHCNGIYISEIDPKGFEVTELNNGYSNVEFSYMVVGKNSNPVNPIRPAPVVYKNTNVSELIYDNSAILKKNKIREER